MKLRQSKQNKYVSAANGAAAQMRRAVRRGESALIPGGARALRVGARVPRRRADDQAVVGSDVIAREVANVDHLEARLGRDVAGHGLRVA